MTGGEAPAGFLAWLGTVSGIKWLIVVAIIPAGIATWKLAKWLWDLRRDTDEQGQKIDQILDCVKDVPQMKTDIEVLKERTKRD